MDELRNLIKKSVLNLEPYSSARDEFQDKQGIFLDANENPYDLQYNRYPDPYQRELKKAIGKWKNIDDEYIFLGNGSDEVIDLLISATCTLGEDRILSLDPSYGMYKVSAAINEVEIDLVPLDSNLDIDKASLLEIINSKHKLIFICSPNNPNGAIVDSQLIQELLDTTDNFVIIDEAYIDFSDAESWIHKIGDHPKLIVLQTFSKALGAAGIRIGMGFMNPYLVKILNKIKPPYNISQPNQEIAISRLQNMNIVNGYVHKLKTDRDEMKKALEQLSIVNQVFLSEANFLLVKFQNHQLIFDSLKEKGIVVRDRSSHTNCEGCIRFSIGTSKENQKLLAFLKSIK